MRAATPAKLRPLSNAELTNSIVTNNAHPGQLRILYRKLRMELRDVYDNKCTVDTVATMRAEILPNPGAETGTSNSDDNGTGTVELPLLEEAKNNQIQGVLKQQGSYFEFDEISIDPKTRCLTGVYLLRIRFTSGLISLHHDISFQYASQAQFSLEKSLLEQELSQLVSAKQRFVSLGEDLKALKKQRREQLTKVSNVAQEAVDDLDTLRGLFQHRFSQWQNLQKRVSTAAPRSASKGVVPDPVLLANSQGLGQVVDLAYVNDVNEARIVSYHAQRFLDAWVVKEASVAQQLFAKGVKAWALDLVKAFTLRTRQNTLR